VAAAKRLHRSRSRHCRRAKRVFRRSSIRTRAPTSARYDWSERAANAAIQDVGTSAVLTFWPSEFSQVRGQYRRTRYGHDDRVANELLFQVLFTIGAHGAHPF